MGRIQELIRQFCRFSMVGTLCFGIDYGVLVLLTESGLCSYIAASAISYTTSIIVNYILSMKFVFNGREDMHKIVELMIWSFECCWTGAHTAYHVVCRRKTGVILHECQGACNHGSDCI